MTYNTGLSTSRACVVRITSSKASRSTFPMLHRRRIRLECPSQEEADTIRWQREITINQQGRPGLASQVAITDKPELREVWREWLATLLLQEPQGGHRQAPVAEHPWRCLIYKPSD